MTTAASAKHPTGWAKVTPDYEQSRNGEREYVEPSKSSAAGAVQPHRRPALSTLTQTGRSSSRSHPPNGFGAVNAHSNQ
jgi:hypothetical protein